MGSIPAVGQFHICLRGSCNRLNRIGSPKSAQFQMSGRNLVFKMSFLSPRLVVFPGQTLVRARALVKIGSMWVFRWGKWTFHPPSHKSAADRLAVSFLSSLPALLQFISLLVPVMALCTLGERFYFFTWTPEANTTLDVNFNRIPFKFCE